jgi:hypothetical protein
MKRFAAALVAVIAAAGLTTAGAQDEKTTRISIGEPDPRVNVK